MTPVIASADLGLRGQNGSVDPALGEAERLGWRSENPVS